MTRRQGARRAGGGSIQRWPLRIALLAVAAAVVLGALASASTARIGAPRKPPGHALRPILPSGQLGPPAFSPWPRQRRHAVAPVAPGARAAIVGGAAATQGQLGFMAFVVYQVSDSSYQICSGTVLAPNVVLTAGHCAVDESTGALLNPAQFEVVTNAVDWTNTSLRRVSGVSRILVDPDYEPSSATSDAALLVLSSPTTAPSIQLASNADVSLEQPGTGAIIAGWGETSPNSGTVTQNLMWASTVVQSPNYCSQVSLPPFTYDPTVKLCAVNSPFDDTGTCSGDSGGPLLTSGASGQPVEIGITSYGPSDCDTVTADFFTTAEPLSGWVDQELQAVATHPPTSHVAPPKLPRLTLAAARSYAQKTLAKVLGRAFKRRAGLKLSCSRVSSTRANCKFSFSSPQNYYYGTVTVYDTGGSADKVYWANHYTIHSVNGACYFRSGHRSSCKLHTKRGSS